jgi:hypothetical protein
MIDEKFNDFNRNFDWLPFSQIWFYSYGKKDQIDLKKFGLSEFGIKTPVAI